jgi:hypothetical protein
MGEQLSKMEDWDKISQCITQVNQARAFTETETISSIDELLAVIEQCKNDIGELEPGSKLTSLLATLAEEADHVDLISRKRDEGVFSAVSQLKQSVTNVLEGDERRDDLGITSASPEQLDLIDRALAWHFLHEGYLDTAKTFSKEAKLNCLPEVDLIRVQSGMDAADAILQRKDLAPAIAWLEEYSSATSPNLLFDLHRLRFLQLASSQTEAIGYAQRNFARFTTSRSQEIQTLLGSLIFHGPATVPNPNNPSPTSSLNDERSWHIVHQALVAEVRRTYGSMSVLIGTGSRALPELRMYQELVAPDSRIGVKTWTEGGEIPIQVETDFHFHSEFCCPVSREQTDSQSNPPMLLTCGHVIAKSSILRIAKHRQRFKCPTCPTEQAVDAPTSVQF